MSAFTNVQSFDVAVGSVSAPKHLLSLMLNYEGAACPSGEHGVRHTSVEVADLVKSAVENLRDVRKEMTALFHQQPVDMSALADLVQHARQVHRWAAAHVANHLVDRHQCYKAHRDEELTAITERHHGQIASTVHKLAFNFLSWAPRHRATMVHFHDKQMAKLDAALEKVHGHHRLVFLDDGFNPPWAVVSGGRI